MRPSSPPPRGCSWERSCSDWLVSLTEMRIEPLLHDLQISFTGRLKNITQDLGTAAAALDHRAPYVACGFVWCPACRTLSVAKQFRASAPDLPFRQFHSSSLVSIRLPAYIASYDHDKVTVPAKGRLCCVDAQMFDHRLQHFWSRRRDGCCEQRRLP